jgi:hypothetical protein
MIEVGGKLAFAKRLVFPESASNVASQRQLWLD